MTFDHGAAPLRSTRKLTNFARPGWFTITNSAAVDGPAIVAIYNEIGMYGTTAAEFMAEVQKITGPIEMHINSPGGDVFDGIAIYNQLKRRGGVHVIVDGLAASAASFIAQAAAPGKLEMAPHSQMMIHNGFAMAAGDAADMRKTADLLDQVTSEIAGIYADRSGKPAQVFLEMMSKETWLTDRQAVEAGLADRISGSDDGQDSSWDLSVYAKFDKPFNAATNPDDNNGWLMREGQWTFDPKDDGDDDYQASTDTDHDYWDSEGHQLHPIPASPDGKCPAKPMPDNDGDEGMGNRLLAAIRMAKYKQEDRDRMSKSGEAMPDGSYPIADEQDLANAIHAVGRGGADHDAIRRHIIKRAAALGKSAMIPDNWSSDGSLSDSSNQGIGMLLANALKG